MEILSHIRRLI